MSHSALARIADAATAYVSAQAETPIIDEGGLPTVKVAGVTIASPSAREAALSKRRGAALQFQADAKTLTDTLAQAGVTSLGTVPKEFWNQLCREAGLYHLRPDKDGRVTISTAYLAGVKGSATRVAMLRPLVVLLTTTALSVPLSLLAGFGWWTLLAAPVAGALVSAVTHRLWFEQYEKPRTSVLHAIERRQLKQLQKLSVADLKQICWPNYVEPTNGIKVGIELPPPPKEVVVQLSKIAGTKLPLSLYVHPEAVAFVQHPYTAFADQQGSEQRANAAAEAEQKRLEAERKKWERAFDDPIVAVEHGSAIAIIAQYGEFPIEQATVERALAAHPLF